VASAAWRHLVNDIDSYRRKWPKNL